MERREGDVDLIRLFNRTGETCLQFFSCTVARAGGEGQKMPLLSRKRERESEKKTNDLPRGTGVTREGQETRQDCPSTAAKEGHPERRERWSWREMLPHFASHSSGVVLF